jgi:ectoine hydroxylase-related dioxygenase (phytanoyl-CoA dioxygenase family)
VWLCVRAPVVLEQGVFSPEEVAAANTAVDAHVDQQLERGVGLRNTRDNTAMSGDGSTGRLDLGRCLEWPSPHSGIFRQLLAHPRMVPYFHELCGSGYRMDHLPLVLAQNEGAEGFQLHGGVTAPVSGKFQPHLEYSFRHGAMHNMLIGCTIQLCDHDPGDGGFCIVKGSHKANFPMSEAMVHGFENSEHIYQPVTKAGDVLIFSEAATHGSLPWTRSDKQRRVALFRFSPANVAYGRNYMAEGGTSWPAAMYDGLTPEQAAVLQAPFAGRLDRVELAVDEQGQVSPKTFARAAEKKDFDKAVLGDKTIGL